MLSSATPLSNTTCTVSSPHTPQLRLHIQVRFNIAIMPADLNSIVKGLLQVSLIVIFWIYFGRLSINRFQREDVLVSSSTIAPDPDGLRVPAITICARNTSTSLGWKGNPNITTTKEVLAHTCGDAQNVTECILEKTFGQGGIYIIS